MAAGTGRHDHHHRRLSGAAGIAAAVRAGERSAREVVQSHLDRIAAVQPELNAFTLVDGDAALVRADAIDVRLARGEELGTLAGVPVGLKDIVDQAGRPTTAGSKFHREVAAESAPVVRALEAQDAVIVGRTGLHEFAFGFSSENHWWGPVRNPWDASLSPGGSSGGSASAVAAGCAPLAVGTDTGGSVRVPAALCGLVGLKVTHGRISLHGVFPLAPSLDTVGPLARTVADAALGYAAMAGHDPADPWSAPQPVEVPDGPADLAGLRVGVPRPWADAPLAPGLRDAFTAALDALTDAGAHVEDVVLPELEYPGLMSASFAPEVAAVHRRWFPDRPDDYGPEVASRLADAFAVTADEHERARAWRAGVTHAFARALAGRDVLATPTVAANRKVIGADTVEIGGRAVPYRAELSRFSALVNQAGLPALALPLPGPARPPASLQLIGHPWSESRLLATGLALEARSISEVGKTAESCI